MNPAISQEHEPLRAQLEEAQKKIDGLEENLRAIDGELQALAPQREQYELLEQVCVSLEKLDTLARADLFWGQRVEGGKASEHVRQVRQRVDTFREQLSEIQGRRQSVVEELKEGQGVLDILEDDWSEVLEEQERIQNEWIVEREIVPLPDRPLIMPWTRGRPDDWRFRKSLATSLAVALLFGLLLPMIDLPLPEPMEALEVPERLARLIRQEQQRPLPPAPPREELPPEIPEPEPEPVVAEEQPPTEVPPPKPTETPEPAPAVAQEPPRPRAEQSGLLAFRENFSNLAERPSAKLGSDARIRNAGDAAIGRPERSMVTTQKPGSSGGINLAALSRDVGGGGSGGSAMAGVQASRVASSIGPGGGGDRPRADGSGGGGAAGGRTDEEIQIVFDRYKAALYRLYNRELRKDPTLRGQMVLRLTIEPNGSVSFCQLQSTDMNSPELVREVVERVKTFDFGAKDVPPITILYPIDFLPAA